MEKPETAERSVGTRPPKAERETIVTSGLPTLKDLLPPDFSRSSGARRSEKPIRLDDRDPKHVAYLSLIHQALKTAWTDPNVARYATRPSKLEGTPVVRFTIDEDGNLEEVFLLYSSGYSALDQEAVRIVQAAAPHFGVVPRSFGKNKIVIDVKIVYEKDVPTYSFVP
jgi:TonB family protein